MRKGLSHFLVPAGMALVAGAVALGLLAGTFTERGTTPVYANGPVVDTGLADYGTKIIGVSFDVEVYANPIPAGGGGAGTGMSGYQFSLNYTNADLQTVTTSDMTCPFGMVTMPTPVLGNTPYSIGCFFMPPKDAGAAGNVLLNTVKFSCQQAATDTAITPSLVVVADETGGDLGATAGSGAVVDCEQEPGEPTATTSPTATVTNTPRPTSTPCIVNGATCTPTPPARKRTTPTPTATETPLPTATEVPAATQPPPPPAATATPFGGPGGIVVPPPTGTGGGSSPWLPWGVVATLVGVAGVAAAASGLYLRYGAALRASWRR